MEIETVFALGHVKFEVTISHMYVAYSTCGTGNGKNLGSVNCKHIDNFWIHGTGTFTPGHEGVKGNRITLYLKKLKKCNKMHETVFSETG